jgi:hypothetical protein
MVAEELRSLHIILILEDPFVEEVNGRGFVFDMSLLTTFNVIM